MSNPDGVVASDKSVRILYNILRSSYEELNQIINDPKTNPLLRASKQRTIAQIEAMAMEKEELAEIWTEVFISGHYDRGIVNTSKKLHAQGAIINSSVSNGRFHARAVNALSADTYNDIARAIKGITKTGKKLLTEADRIRATETIGKALTKGDELRKIKKELTRQLKESGIVGLKDIAGRNWQLDRYTEMLARTKLTQAHNSGVANRMQENGYDLIIISDHADECPLCAPYENVVLSLTGRSPNYTSLKEAESKGLFHPNCRHTYTPYHKRYLDQAVAYNYKTGDYELIKNRVSLSPRPIPSRVKYKKLEGTK